MDHTSTGAAPVKTGKADRRADLPFLVITLTLLGVGVVMVLSASFASAYYDLQGETGHNPVYFFSRQAIFAAAGVCVMLIASRIPMRVYRACALPLLLVSVASLAAVLVIGTVVNGARRWISLGFTTFQPSEITKIAIILYFSALICKYKDRMRTFRYGIAPFAAILAVVSALLVLEPHFSATIIILAIGASMLFLGGVRLHWFIGAAGVLLLYLCFAIRGIVTAARAKSDVSSFTAVGLTSIIVLQAFIIVGGVTRLIPLTGITLPFISQGGSSLIASFIIVGCLLRCGDEGTGVNSEMRQTGAIGAHGSDAVLGRVALGKRLTGTMIVFSVLFAVLVANLTYLMVIKAPEYQSMPSNNHTIAKEARMERGTISTADGTVLATSVRQEDGSYKREYPAGELAAHIVGYTSQRFGTAGIEAAYNDTLRGEQNFASFTDVVNSLAGIQTKGNDVVLSIDSRIQQAAQDALAGQVGAVVALNPETGAVYALASSPTFDAANYEELLTAAADGGSDSSELFNRATQALYAPGSTFKMVTLAAALQNHIATADTVYDSPGEMDIGNAPVTNVKKRSYGKITLEQALWYSSNTVFGQVGVELGSDLLVQMATSFGFNEAIPFDLPLATSLMPDPEEMTTWETAWAACGEPVGEHESPAGPQATVLQMALVGSAIANEGAIMQPYLVDGIYNANGERSFSPIPVKLKQAMDADTAAAEIDIMKGVVTEGTGGKAALDDVAVAGKTGTHERGDGSDDSWFVGMAPAADPKVVVAVVIEKGESGAGASAAHDVLETALEVTGAL